MIIRLAVVLSAFALGAADEGVADDDFQCLRDQMLELDREIAGAQIEGRQQAGVWLHLPAPFRVESVSEYLSLIKPTETEREKLEQAFVAFQQEYLAVQRRFLPGLWEAAAASSDVEGDEQVELADQRYKLLQRFDRHSQSIEALLIGKWRAILEDHIDFDADVLTFVKHDRLRQRYSIWSSYALPEARPDVFEITIRHLPDDDLCEEILAVLHQYIAQRGQLMRNRFQAKVDVIPKSVSLTARHLHGELPWDDFIRERSRTRRPIVVIDSHLERLNRHTLSVLKQHVDASHLSRIKDEYRSLSYRSLFPDHADAAFRETVNDWLENLHDDPALTDIVMAVFDEYVRWYDDQISRFMRQISLAERALYQSLTFYASEADEQEKALAAFQHDRDQRIERIKALMHELSVRADHAESLR